MMFHSRLSKDTLLIEDGLARGVHEIHIVCEDVEKSWESFRNQFAFIQAAGGIVTNSSGEILSIYRLGKWDLPKGKVEDGEEIAEAAVREVEEECSITGVQLKAPLITTWHTYLQDETPMLKATAWFAMEYLGNEIPKPQTIEGITEVRWVSPNDLDEMRGNTYGSILDVLVAFLPKQGK